MSIDWTNHRWMPPGLRLESLFVIDYHDEVQEL
jgi:hypothetical protein